jgi:hypothetical protein
MNKPAPKTDVINELLEECLMHLPGTPSMIISLYQQYQKRGFLTKKQLQGLHAKASGIPAINPGKLATLEAIIKKMPNRFKSELPEPEPVFKKDDIAGGLIEAILAKYPLHKRVLYLKSKYDNNEALTAAEVTELHRFHKLLK